MKKDIIKNTILMNVIINDLLINKNDKIAAFAESKGGERVKYTFLLFYILSFIHLCLDAFKQKKLLYYSTSNRHFLQMP